MGQLSHFYRFKMNREYDPTVENTQFTINPRDSLYIHFPENFTFVKVCEIPLTIRKNCSSSQYYFN